LSCDADILAAFHEAGLPINGDLNAVSDDPGAEPSFLGTLWTACVVLADIAQLVGYASMAAAALMKWSPILVTFDSESDNPAAAAADPQVADKGAGADDSPPAGQNWYDLHGPLQVQQSPPPAAVVRNDEEVERLRSEVSALRLELAATQGQVRALQRRTAPSSPLPSAKTPEDLLKPLAGGWSSTPADPPAADSPPLPAAPAAASPTPAAPAAAFTGPPESRDTAAAEDTAGVTPG